MPSNNHKDADEYDGNTLWGVYLDAFFVDPLGTLTINPGADYCILTAHNPLGRLLTDTQNQALHTQLLRTLTARSFPWQPIIGTNLQRSHQEDSLLIHCKKQEGSLLARQFSQNAFYYLHSGTLYLMGVAIKTGKEERIGPFTDRLVADNLQ